MGGFDSKDAIGGFSLRPARHLHTCGTCGTQFKEKKRKKRKRKGNRKENERKMKKEKRCACSACNRFHHSFPGSPVIVGVSVKVFVGFWTLEDFLDFFI